MQSVVVIIRPPHGHTAVVCTRFHRIKRHAAPRNSSEVRPRGSGRTQKQDCGACERSAQRNDLPVGRRERSAIMCSVGFDQGFVGPSSNAAAHHQIKMVGDTIKEPEGRFTGEFR